MQIQYWIKRNDILIEIIVELFRIVYMIMILKIIQTLEIKCFFNSLNSQTLKTIIKRSINYYEIFVEPFLSDRYVNDFKCWLFNQTNESTKLRNRIQIIFNKESNLIVIFIELFEKCSKNHKQNVIF
jgi:hypothetical protein